jgi:cyclopropane fatty-acyl-phospholipid synthase-like methyltransferase
MDKMMKNGIVKDSYDKIAPMYARERNQFENNEHLNRLVNLLNPNSLVLDVGCGSGLPVDQYLIDYGHRVIGIDVSEKQIELARKNVPEGIYEQKDMLDLKEYEYNVDAIVSFYAVFHTPREQHEDILRKCHSYLTGEGLLLVTMGASDWEGKENFHGEEMWWSHYGPEKNKKIIESAGFAIIFDEIDTTGGEKHQVILAKNI